MRNTILASMIIGLATLPLFIIGLYGILAHSEGFYFIFGQAFSMYLLIFHPLIFFILGRNILKQADVRNIPEMLLFNMILLVFFPIVYVLIPVFANAFDNIRSASALEFVFVVFEIAALLTAFVFFIRYAKRMIQDIMVPRDLYTIHHFYIGALVYFYFVRLTIISSLLVSGAGAL